MNVVTVWGSVSSSWGIATAEVRDAIFSWRVVTRRQKTIKPRELLILLVSTDLCTCTRLRLRLRLRTSVDVHQIYTYWDSLQLSGWDILTGYLDTRVRQRVVSAIVSLYCSCDSMPPKKKFKRDRSRQGWKKQVELLVKTIIIMMWILWLCYNGLFNFISIPLPPIEKW